MRTDIEEPVKRATESASATRFTGSMRYWFVFPGLRVAHRAASPWATFWPPAPQAQTTPLRLIYTKKKFLGDSWRLRGLVANFFTQ